MHTNVIIYHITLWYYVSKYYINMYDEIQVDDRYKKFWLCYPYLDTKLLFFESRPNENSKTAWIQLWLAKVDCH